MKKFLTISILFILVVGCRENNSNKATIKLDGNPTTGYEWICEIKDKSIAFIDEGTYEPTTTDSNIVGSGGTYKFIVIGKKEGKTTIICNYKRPFQNNNYDQTKSYDVEVSNNLSISINEIN